jgi:ribonucleotide reductase class II
MTLSPDFVNKYASKQAPWGFGGLGEIVYLRTYARDIESLARKELWHETVERCVNGALEIGADLTDGEAETLYDHVFNLRASFSGRALWQLGTPLVRAHNAASLNNCYFTNIEKVEDFEFLFDHLMLGGGVGYSVERSKIHDLPKVNKSVRITHERTNDADLIVPDSRRGWSRLVHAVLKSYFYTGKSFTYSTMLIREFGAPLATFGGTASGPGALIDGIADICKVMEHREGKKLRSIDVLDICNIIGRIVISGSSRRSAQIAIGDPDDVLFMRAKNWSTGAIPGWRANSNNSVYADAFDEIMPELWNGYDGSGEPYGLINRRLARKVGRLGERHADPTIEGFNPCVTGDTWVLTDGGPKRVTDLLEDTYTAIVDGKPYSATAFWKTGEKPVLCLSTSEGYTVRVTEDHKILTPNGWVKAGALEIGDPIMLHDHLGASWSGEGSEDEGYVLGHLVGDGTFYPDGTPALSVFSSDLGSDGPREILEGIVGAMPHRCDYKGWRLQTGGVQSRIKLVAVRDLASRFGIVRYNKTVTEEVERASSAFYTGFLRGLFDTDGSVEGKSNAGGVSIRLSQSDYPMLEAVQRMLARLGVKSSLKDMYAAGRKVLPGGIYDTKASYRLIISGENAERFMNLIGFANQRKAASWTEKRSAMTRGFYYKASTAVVSDIVEAGVEDVYDCTVDEAHAFDANGIYVHNCAEIALGDGESCNLATIFLPNITGEAELIEVSRLLYKVQKAIAGMDYPYEKTNKVVRKNMRLGQSITGVLQSSVEQLSWLDRAYVQLKEYDAIYSAERGLPASIRLTTVQPSGTLSLLPGVTPGVHPAFAKFYIRRVRFGVNDPLVEKCRKRGYPVCFDIGIDGREDHSRYVVSFPCRSPENAVLAADMTAVDQLEWVKRLQTEWADNAVSVTVYYRLEELASIKEWLAKNYNDSIKSVSFLLHADHNFPLPPYEEFTEKEYEKMLKAIDFSVPMVDNYADGELFDDCAGGACPVR